MTADGVAGKAANVQGTPTLIFKGPKGTAAAPSGRPELQRPPERDQAGVMSAVGPAPASPAEAPERDAAARGRPPLARADRLTLAIVVLCLLGIADAGYLTYVHYSGAKVICGLVGSGCHTVQTSQWSKLAGVPVALLGLISYIAILGSLAIRGERGRAIGFGLALVGFGFSMYLTYRELFSIHAICQWCVGSAVLMTLLAVTTTARFLRSAPGP